MLTKTGIDGFDEIMEGGLPEGNVILLIGEPGSGYDTFAQQVLFRKALDGQKIAYFTIEFLPDDIQEDMATFGWHLNGVMSKDNWSFVDSYREKRQGVMIKIGGPEGSSMASATSDLGALTSLKSELAERVEEKRWTAVQTLSHLLLMHNLKDVIDAVETYITTVHNAGGLHFLLMVQGMHDPTVGVTMRHLADGVIEFTSKEVAGSMEGALRVSKMRRMKGASRLIPYSLSDRGIVIETATRIA